MNYSMVYSKICRDAAGIIRKGGLHKGDYTFRGAHCALGAVIRAVGLNPLSVYAEGEGADILIASHEDDKSAVSWANDVAERLRSMMPLGRSVSGWNDEPERTADEVAAFLERAAVDFERDESEAPR